VAVSEFGATVGPSVHVVTAAIPFAPVVTGVVGLTVPPPEATANVTLTPATGLPFASCTITEGGVATVVPAVADWLFPALTAIELAAPAVPVAVKVTGLPARLVAADVGNPVTSLAPRLRAARSATSCDPLIT